VVNDTYELPAQGPVERSPTAVARAYAYRALTNAPPERIAGLARGTTTGWALRLADRLVGRGPVSIAEGPARRLLLSGAHLPLDHVQGFAMVRGLLEASVQEALRRTVARGSVVYDAGANLGFFTLLAARFTGPRGRVEAFEPLPASAAAVRANAALNGFSHVTVHQAALGRETERGDFLALAEPSQSHLSGRGRHPDTREVLEVDVVALDDLLARGHPPPDVIKIDVEGSEIDVLEGARDVLRQHAPAVVCELHETNREVHDLFAEHGYVIENLDGPEPVLEAGPTHILARRAR
jgi:FkbM family methyltransferase